MSQSTKSPIEKPYPDRRRTELARKALHFLIGLAPVLAINDKTVILILLGAGVLSYTAMELFRKNGGHIPVISDITAFASRRRDQGRFVLGPVTLGLGAFFTLLIYPPLPAAIGVYALAFGDGTASLAGKFIGSIRPPFLFGKSVEGSIACFLGTLLSAWLVTDYYMKEGNWSVSLIAAGTATIAELLPFKDWDNVIIPLIVGLAVWLGSYYPL